MNASRRPAPGMPAPAPAPVRALEPRPEPQNLEAEQAVLGACLIERDTIVRLAPLLAAEDFRQHGHVCIYRALIALYERRIPPDLLSVASELRQQRTLEEAGGETYLAELIGMTYTAVHAEHYAGLVRAAAMRRRLVAAAQAVVELAYDESLSLPDTIARADAALQVATRLAPYEGYRAMKDIVPAYYDGLDATTAPPLELGLHDLDRLLGGVRAGQLMLVAARPSIGKSALGIQAAVQVARRGTPVGLISLEMSADEVVDRIAGFTAGVNMHLVRAGRDQGALARVATVLGSLAELPLYLDDRSNMALADVLARARRMYAEAGIRLLVIDYLQLMDAGAPGGRGGGRSENRNQELGVISKALKGLARELGITVLALSQLNRALESRSKPTPQLSDLRDSGALEQDADIVLFIHRPDKYDERAERNVAQLIVAKHRNGPVGMATMRFDPQHSQFVSYTWNDGEG